MISDTTLVDYEELLYEVMALEYLGLFRKEQIWLIKSVKVLTVK
jgi:hypothetical protein